MSTKITSYPYAIATKGALSVRQVIDGVDTVVVEPTPRGENNENAPAIIAKHDVAFEMMNKGALAVVQSEPGVATLTLDGVPFATITVEARIGSDGIPVIQGSVQNHEVALPNPEGGMNFARQVVVRTLVGAGSGPAIDATA